MHIGDIPTETSGSVRRCNMDNATSTCVLALPTLLAATYISSVFSCCVMFVCLLTIATIWRTVELHNNINYFIVSFAVCSMLLSLISTAVPAFYALNFGGYTDGENILETVILGVSYSPIFSSVLHLTAMAIDRFVYVLKPLYYITNMTRKYMTVILLIIWVSTIIYSITPITVYRNRSINTKCIFVMPLEFYVVCLVMDVICYITIFGCYFRIAYVAFQREKARTARKQQSNVPHQVNIVATNWKAAVKSIKFFAAMFGIFCVCYTPLVITTLMTHLFLNVPIYIVIPSHYIFQIHPALNCILNYNMNSHFRFGVKKLCTKSLMICCK